MPGCSRGESQADTAGLTRAHLCGRVLREHLIASRWQDNCATLMVIPMPEKPTKSGKEKWVGAEKYIQLGVTLPAATFIGWIIGVLLDRWLHTGWIQFVGLAFGIAAGFVQLFRMALSVGE
jgi:F0F1-type ATP synthase assembly protein I